ncbi:MAG TPA: hypothetical protein VN843_35460, partial [Anaerolineales bacterium]|nr:hypothetical protein [Anaerolineales bacterium]
QAEQDSNKEVAAAETVNSKKKVNDRFNRLWWWRFSVKLLVLLILFSTILVLGYFRYSVVTAKTVAEVPRQVTFLTYSLLTLIFPIISGICASLSLSNFHNWAERRKAEKHNSDARKVVLEATDEYRKIKEEKEKNDSFLEWLASQDTITQLTKYMIRCYDSGYKFGYRYPEWTFGGDLFTRAEAMRNRNLLEPISPQGGPILVTQTAVN